MIEQAVVEKIIEKRKEGDLVLLKKLRPDACNHCQGKVLCGVNSNFTFKAVNRSSSALQKGDFVEYLLPEVSVIKLSFLVYSVPLISFLTAVLLFQWFIKGEEILSVLFGLVVMVITFLIIGRIDKIKTKYKDRRLPKIQQKI